jgi:hypothetical protein
MRLKIKLNYMRTVFYPLRSSMGMAFQDTSCHLYIEPKWLSQSQLAMSYLRES